MKKILMLLAIAAVMFVGCKKDNQSSRETYRLEYSTENKVLNAVLTSNLEINPANYAGSPLLPVNRRKITYIIEMNGNETFKLNFVKLDDSVYPIELTQSNKVQVLTF
jgi:hypothetical protein